MSSKIIVSLSFAEYLNDFNTCREMINSVTVSGRTAIDKKASYALI